MGCWKSLKLTSVRGKEITFILYHGGGTNQQEDQHEGSSQEGDVCKRSGHDSRQKTRTTGSVGGTEGGVQEARTDNEPGEDRRDVGLTSERGLEH